jgi:hypothetical protein
VFPKYLLRIDVIEGIDVGLRHWMSGDSFTVGSGPQDALRLSEPGIIQSHVTCHRDRKGWRLDVNPSAELQKNGKPLTSGRLRKGDILRLGASTVLSVSRVAVPEDMKEALADVPEEVDVPMPVVLALCVFMLAGFVVFNWYNNPPKQPVAPPADLDHRLSVLASEFANCVHGMKAAGTGATSRGPEPVDLYWRIGALAQQGETDAAQNLAEVLFFELDQAIRRGSLLEEAGQSTAASQAYRHIEKLLPNLSQTGSCGIVDMARKDIARLNTKQEDR